MILDWCGVVPNSEDFTLNHGVRSFRSMLTGKSSNVVTYGTYWSNSMSFSNLSPDKIRAITGMIGKLRANSNQVKVPVWKRKRNNSVGVCSINVATRGSYSISVTNSSANGVKLFSIGDYISFNNEMFEVVDDCYSTGVGYGTVNLNKPLRQTVANGTIIEYLNPYCIMVLDDVKYSVSETPDYSEITLPMREEIL